MAGVAEALGAAPLAALCRVPGRLWALERLQMLGLLWAPGAQRPAGRAAMQRGCECLCPRLYMHRGGLVQHACMHCQQGARRCLPGCWARIPALRLANSQLTNASS